MRFRAVGSRDASASSLRRLAITLLAFAAIAQPARAIEKASEQVSAFYGSFSHSIPIEVPGFRGLEPRIALSYSSEGRNGLVGVGWSLSGFSTIQRVNAGLGSPKFDTNDIYILDGQELVKCVAGSVSPSCTSGGNWSTKIESYLKIKQETNNTWTVWSKDGTRTVYNATINVPANALVGGGTLRWGVSARIDTDANEVDYFWDCVAADFECYPSGIAYNGYKVTFFREARPDHLNWAAASVLGRTSARLRSIIVWAPAYGHIRGYKLTYQTSPLTGRSLLSSLQQFGKDLTHTNGLISGPSFLPEQTFTYQEDPSSQGGRTFVDWAAPPTPPTATEPVTWANLVNTATAGDGSSLVKYMGGSNWNAGADSSRAISAGNGYVQWVASGPVLESKAAGLSNGNTDASLADIDYAFIENPGTLLLVYEKGVPKGTFTRASGDRLRIEVSGGIVYYKKNDVTLLQSTQAPLFPLRVDTSIHGVNDVIQSVTISGQLTYVNAWCQAILMTADFNGDGRTDQLCYTTTGGVFRSHVALAGPTAFGTPTLWNTGMALTHPVIADFNNDGKADIATHDPTDGRFWVALSNGTNAFQAPAPWGTAVGAYGTGPTVSCVGAEAVTGAGDFNGDGLTDVFCKRPNVESNYNFVGLARFLNGTWSFQFSVFGNFSCDSAEARIGAIDFDGDGKDDWYCIGAVNSNLQVYTSTGTSFLWPAFGALSFCSYDGYVLGDFNGDGRTDASCRNNGRVALSMGRSFLEQGEFGGWCIGDYAQAFGADVDGDGASEMVCNNQGDGATDIQVRKWVGSGQSAQLAPAETWKPNWCGGKVAGGDWNGDGKTDLYCTSTVAPAVAGTSGRKVDIASTFANGLGGTVQLSYTPSSAFTNTNNPTIKHTVTALTIADGLGWTATNSYAYSGGLMDWKERTFLGFRTARKTLPCVAGESSCPFIDTVFRQDLASAGKPESVARRHGNGNFLAMQSFTHATNEPTIPRVSLLVGQTTHSFESAGCPLSTCGQQKQTTITHHYDAYGNRTQSTFTGDLADPLDNRTTTLSYVPNPSLYIVASPSEERHLNHAGAWVAESRFRYDNLPWAAAPVEGHLTRIDQHLKNATEDRWVPTTTLYSPSGNVTSVTDPTTRTATTTYDAVHDIYPETLTNPALPNEAETTTWDPVCGVPGQHVDANGLITTFQYDALCRQTRKDEPLGGFEEIFYREFGDPNRQRIVVETPSATADGGDQYIAQHFDGLSRAFYTVTKGPSQSQPILTLTTFNARGAVASQTAPYYATDPSFATSYSYDALDRLTGIHHPDGETVGKAYGIWTETTTDETGIQSTQRFDAYGRIKTLEQQLNGGAVITTFNHDSLGRLISVRDALDNAWAWEFDTLSRATRSTHPDTGARTFGYDDAGRVTRQRDAKNQVVDVTYDAAGEVATRRTYDAWGSLTAAITYTFSEPRSSFFNKGLLTTVAGPGTTRLENDYDARGRLVRQRRTLDGVEYTTRATFDAGDRPLTLQYPDGESIGPFAYDQAGRLSSIPSILTEVLWDASGRAIRQANANGTTVESTLSAERGFLQRIRTTNAQSQTIQDLQYAYLDNGMVDSISSPNANESWNYGYDDLYRLTSAQNVSAPANSQSWIYDAIGRITYNSRVGTYSYPPPGAPRPHAPTGAGPHTFAYDNNGNLLSGAGRAMSWDAENLVVSANGVQFTYDAFGERVKKTSGSNATRYPVGDNYEITNGVTTKYIDVEGLGVVAKKVSGSGAGDGWYFLHTDGVGSIQAVTKGGSSETGGGTVVQRRTYRPYGEKIADTTSHIEKRGWIDQRQDEETGLTYLHARYYDPLLGLFLSSDPIGPEGGLNSYLYSSGDPVNWSDRSGLDEDPFSPDDGNSGSGGGPGGPTSDDGWFGFILKIITLGFYNNDHKAPPPPRPPSRPRPGDATTAPHPTPPPPAPPGTMVPVPGPGPSTPPGAPPPMPLKPRVTFAYVPQMQTWVQRDEPFSFGYRKGENGWINLRTETYDGTGPLAEAAVPSPGSVATRLGLRALHANAAASTRPTAVYSLWRRLPDGSLQFLKWGVTSNNNPLRRYTTKYMADKVMRIHARMASRRYALDIERGLVKRNPGPLNKEPWAGKP